MKRPFIAFGTGRCGTSSLFEIIDYCENTYVLREDNPYKVSWYDPDQRKLDRLARHLMRKNGRGITAGSVSRYWLPHIEYLRQKMPGLKLICLHRDKKGTVESFMRYKGRLADRLRPGRRPLYRTFPLIAAPTIRESYELYWEMYEEWSRTIEGVYHVDMDDLNDRKKIAQIFDYLEMPEKNRRRLFKTKHNASRRSWIEKQKNDPRFR